MAKLICLSVTSVHYLKILFSGWISGEQMSTKLELHCMVWISPTKVIVIGGRNDVYITLGDTFIFDSATEVWSPGPKLKIARHYHRSYYFSLWV